MMRRIVLAVNHFLNSDLSDLAAYRIVCVLICFLVPLFWLLYGALDQVYDPLWMRLVLMGACMLLLGASFVSTWVRDHFVVGVYVLIYLIGAWAVWLASANGFSGEHTAGLLFVFFGSALVLGMVRHRPLPLACYLLFFLSLTAVAAYTVPEVRIDRTVLLTCVGSGALVTCLAGYLKIQTEEALRRSESNLAQAQHVASLGHWEWNLSTNTMRWSDETYRLFGLSSEQGIDPFEIMREAIDPTDRGKVQQFRRALKAGETPEPIDYRIVTKTGEERVLRSQAQVETGVHGKPIRVLGTVQDITAQTRYEEKLIAARVKAEEMARLKDTFLTNMSHEIRTPLSVILGAAHSLRDELDDDALHLADWIEENGHRLLETLNSVLDLACIESGDYRLQCQSVSVGEEVQEIAALFHARAEAKGLCMNVALNGHPVQAWADLDALRRILTHLVNNAIKFTESGSVCVGIEEDTHQVRIYVKDTGIGIGEAFMPYLFSEFKQESSGLARKYEGCGLGLALSRRLAALMGGTLSVTSSKGEGSTFTLTLKRAGSVSQNGHTDNDVAQEEVRITRA